MVGATVGNYRIYKLLATGGMGAVYLAEHPGIGRKAAVKILRPDLAQDPEMSARFLNEARAANAIRHPGIVEIFDSGVLPNGAPYIVMELLEGESLAARIERCGALPVAEAIDIVCQAADALAAAHAAGIVHRDLKPDNLFLIGDLRVPGRELVKVLDFGIAKLGLRLPAMSSLRTQTGSVMGTPAYMSPEQCRGIRDVDHRTDIYALGVIAYELVVGRPPFQAEAFGEMAHLHIGELPPPPGTLNPDLPAEIEAVVLQALEKDPSRRFQSAKHLEQELRRAAIGWRRPGPIKTAPLHRQPAAAGSNDHPRVRARTTLGNSAIATGPRMRASWMVPGGIVLVLAALAISIGPLLRGGRESSTDPAVARRMRVEAGQPASVPATVPHGIPPATTVEIQIQSGPTDARVLRERDGEEVGTTPLKLTLPRGTGSEVWIVEKRGFVSQRILVPLDRGLVEKVQLMKQRPATRGPARPAPARKETTTPIEEPVPI
jgi:eukaryotic-like serine/threonine-protein kinase